MTLAARCPACGTVFRVVQDQLRVSEGWVRCGRCAEVFNAIESLVEIEADVAPREAASAHGRERVLGELARVARAPDIEPVAPTPTPTSPTAQATAVAAPVAAIAPGPAPPEPTDLQVEADLRAAHSEPPTFMRRAERAARWRRPKVRATLSAIAIAGGAALPLQAAIEYRDLLAARWPAAQALLEPVCSVGGCRIEAPRAIESLAVESSGLVRIDGTPLYRLSVVLRNRAPLALALPAIDLSLTDSQGGLIARRVVRLAELGVNQSSVAGLAALSVQATLGASERAVSGYTIEIFYP